MADEAILKIIVDAEGSEAPSAPPSAARPAGVGRDAVDLSGEVFDPKLQAMRQLEALEKKQAVKREMDKLAPEALPAEAAPEPSMLAEILGAAKKARVPGANLLGSISKAFTGAGAAAPAAATAVTATAAGAGAGAGAAATGAAGATGAAAGPLVAAGPVGVAIAATLAALKVIDMAGDAAAGLVKSVGAVTAGLIKMGGVDALGAVGTGLEDFGGKLAYIAPVFGVALKIAGAGIQAFVQALDAVSSYAKRFEQTSPDIAFAQAKADVRMMIGDIRRAQTMGPNLARFIEARSKFENSWEDFKVRFIVMIEPFLTYIMTALEKMLTNFDTGIEMVSGIFDGVLAIKATMDLRLGDAATHWENLQKRVEAIRRKLEGDDEVDMPFEQLRRSMPDPWAGQQMANATEQQRRSRSETGLSPAFAF
jgi:hypothetical protein